jgi:hypothetical protein
MLFGGHQKVGHRLQKANLSVWRGWRGNKCDVEKQRKAVVGTRVGKRLIGIRNWELLAKKVPD